MRNAFRILNHHRHRHRHAALLSKPLYHDVIRSRVCTDNPFSPHLFHRKFSSVFTSVHGGRPSAEYAKLRKESLESEFGQALADRNKRVSVIYRFGPFLALYRAAIITFHVTKLTFWHFWLSDIRTRAVKFRETLIRLGPFYIKLGQALGTRPDILPSVYCQELAKLQVQWLSATNFF
ncbi:hypothetical protein Tsubulata_042946 [Turnera subulata]|uniref:ABC1 atypical kinase-like domain-containing protein n=1 Tax=Turnera subulata TaxID=218843 RepID=A0A9Q0F797_9ROSI|nr:hypothetical protein Tsubulata_042946 [Turnera subulata]